MADVEVDALVGRRLRWWWKRLRRTLEEVVGGGGLVRDVIVCLVGVWFREGVLMIRGRDVVGLSYIAYRVVGTELGLWRNKTLELGDATRETS